MSEDQFTKLFKYMEGRFNDLELKLEAKADKTDMDRVFETLDTIIQRLDANDQERVGLSYQVNRHEGWIQQLADNTGTRLASD